MFPAREAWRQFPNFRFTAHPTPDVKSISLRLTQAYCLKMLNSFHLDVKSIE